MHDSLRRLSPIAFLSLALILSLSAGPLPASQAAVSSHADLYVSPAGNDSWSGTLEAPNAAHSDGPFATLERARREVQNFKKRKRAGEIIVMLREGTYFLGAPLNFSSADSGSEAAPVVYAAYPGEKPVISGGRRVTGWKQVSSGRWVANLDPNGWHYFEQLFIKNERRYRPRLPKKGYFYNDGPVFVDSQSENCRFFAQRRGAYACFDRFSFHHGDLQSNYANITDVEIDDFEKWTMSKMRLRSVEGNIAYLTGPTFQNADNYGFIERHRFLVENVKEALSDPGEWYLDRSNWQLTYLSNPGENPETDGVIVPQLPQLLLANGLSYVTFRGLTFAHDNWVVPDEGHYALQSEPKVPAALSFRGSNHIVFDECVLAHTGGWALDFVTGDGPSFANVVQHSVLYDLGTGGIRVGDYFRPGDSEDSVSRDNRFENNLITGGGRVLPSGIGMGIWLGNSPGNTITHNEIYDIYGGGIGVCVPTPRGCPFPHDNTISFNHIYNIGEGMISDFAGIYVAAYKTTGNKVVNNWVHDITHNFQDHDGYGGQGIYLDNITSNVLVENNVVYRASEATIFNNKGANNTYNNNILAYGREGIIKRGGFEERGGNRQRMMRENQDRPFGRMGGRRRGPGGQGQGRQRRQDTEGREMPDFDKPVLYFTHNIALFSHGGIQKTPGQWICARPDNEEPVPCTQRFFFDSNLYWGAGGERAKFATANADNFRQTDEHSLDDWRKLGEDQGSMIEDPKFKNPHYPEDDFTLLPGSPATKIGFKPFDYKQAGLTSAPIMRPPKLAPAFPLQVMRPDEY